MGVKTRERLRDYLRENVRSPIPDTRIMPTSLETYVNYRDDEHRGLDVGVTPATLVREVVAGTPSIMGG